ncbi:MAG: LytR/AlgR family response regulator transcription factor [Saprospiraceae bacterium]
MKIRALIVDDESKLRKVTMDKLARLCPNIEVVGEAANVPDAYSLIKSTTPDLVFLDIAMPGENAFDLLERFESIEFEIIFITGFNDFAIDALRVSAIDYVLKPVGDEELIAAVNKAVQRIQERDTIKRYEVLRHNIDHIGQQSTRIAIPSQTAYDFISVDNIIRCEGWEKYTRIHLETGEVLIASLNIGHFRELLTPYGFYSTHKSHLINKRKVIQYKREGLVILNDKSEVPVARRRRDKFIQEVLGS